jgi:hypothetical protein
MSKEDNHGRERDVQERIKSLMQAAGQARKKQITGEELQKLKSAASRLDQMLKSSADADLETLRSAAARLDQLLADIGTGKDSTRNFKRRRGRQKRGE